MNSEERQFELLKKMSFVRTSGSEKEMEALNILKAELDSLGLKSKVEPFKVMRYQIKKAKLEVLEPFYKEFKVEGVGLTGNTSQEGLTAELEYVESAEEVNLVNAKGKIVLVNGYMRAKKFRDIVRAGAIGYIVFSGEFMDDEEKTDIAKNAIREKHLEFGKIPGVTMRVKDALEMVKLGATKVRITLEQEEGTTDSHNLITEIKGTQYPEEVVAFMAHYDSVPFSSGAYDNGAGSVNIMEILRHYLENPPKRTLRFMWFGSEEVGLLGSKAYVKEHEKELENIKFGINVDLGGAIIGQDMASIIANESLCHMIEYYAKEVCFPILVKQSIYSSDCMPFADKGIPVANFMRVGEDGAIEIHNRYDIIENISPKNLYKSMNFIKNFSEKIVNAAVIPVPREIPEKLVKEIDEYLMKDLK
ncbi:M28 family peptidase [Haloimpatiens massiliensis]|uniref:M28 family peptidase n=1 Tax=Haloimpatiens massiliensis TaxID=1658110 RepID=UPI000C843D36|nr:M28 family peptidase [Haloimpatiens massiliensis]